MFRALVAGIACAALAGCISAEQRAANQRAEWERQQAEQQRFDAARRAYTDDLRRQCAAIGYHPDTDPFRQCILQLHSNNQASDAQTRAVLMQQLLQGAREQQYRQMPYCSSLPAGIAGYQRAQGTCK